MEPTLAGQGRAAGAPPRNAGAVPSDDAVLPATRWLAGLIIPFLAVAFVVLYPFPGSTRQWFAWEIKPTITPMVLGAAYLGGVWFFARAVTARSWHHIKVGFVPVALFAASLGVATILHWGKFNHDHVAFWLWAGLYFTTPFVVAAVWWRNRARERPAEPDEARLPRVTHWAAGATGLAAPALGLVLFVVPEQAARFWPWAITPLTGRVLGAVLMLGVAGLGLYLDPRRSTARIMLEVATVMLGLMLIAGVRARSEIAGDRPLTWLLAIGLAAVLAGSAWFTFGERRAT